MLLTFSFNAVFNILSQSSLYTICFQYRQVFQKIKKSYNTLVFITHAFKLQMLFQYLHFQYY